MAEIQLNARVISKVELSARVMTLRVAADGGNYRISSQVSSPYWDCPAPHRARRGPNQNLSPAIRIS